MRHSAYLWIIPALLLIIVIAVAVRGFGLNRQVQTLKDENRRAVTALQDSLKRMQADFSAAKEAMPGLGEYMTTMQLHAGKLWFASKATNWELAEYELDELKETMEAAKALNAEKNGVKISIERFGFRPPDSSRPASQINKEQEPSRISEIV